MALTLREFTGTGLHVVHDVDFDLGYIRREFVYVYLQGDHYTNQLDYFWRNSTQIELREPVAADVKYEMRRVVPRNELVNDYEDGAILRESNLDASFLQSLMILEEVEDGFSSVDGDFQLLSDLDMRGNDIKNVGQLDTNGIDMNSGQVKNLADATDAQDAVTLHQLQQLQIDVGGVAVTPVVAPRQIADGVATVYLTPASEYITEAAFFVSLDGVSQRPVTDFTVTASGDLEFDSVPDEGTLVDITLFMPRVSDAIHPEDLPDLLPEYTVSEFATVADMIAGNSQNLGVVDSNDFLGRKVSTVINNITSNAGGAEYIYKTPSQAASDGDVIDEMVNHTLGDGNVAVIVVSDKILASQAGALFDGSDDSAAIQAADSYGPFTIDGPVFIDTNTTLTNKFDALFRDDIEITKGLGVDFITPANSVVWAEWFGAVPDYNYTTKTGTNNGPKFRSAINTGANVQVGVGAFGLEGTLQGNRMQVFKGFGNPQRGSKEEPSMTELIWMDDVDGISTEDNDANGFAVEDFILRADYQQANFTSTKTCLKFGEEGASGGTSSQIKCRAKNILTVDWHTGAGIHGFGYETVMQNVLHSNFIEFGFKITDQSNIVSLYDCGGLNSAIRGGTKAKGLYVSEAFQVNAYTFRAENNRVGVEVRNGGSLHMVGSYSEGNRVIDYIVDDDDSQLVIDSYEVFHENEGVTTAAIFSVGSNATGGHSLVARNGTIKVTKGAAGKDNDLTQMLLNNSTGDHYIEITNVDWQAVGTLWAGSGKGPDKLTIRQLPHIEIVGRGVGSNVSVAWGRTTASGSPADSVFTLTNYDATTQLVGKGTGARMHRVDASTVDFYYWDGASWQASNK
jgi:hypothetical protein